MSKYFWNTIIFFIFVSLVFLIIIFIKQNNEQQKSDNLEKTPITSKYVEILTDEMKQNLEKNAPQILENLKITKENINSIINENIDKLFDEIIDKNLDGYLDFHYSVKGEYTEFGAILFEDFFGNINELINEKVLGKDFNEKLNAMSNTIVNDTDKQIFEHINFTTNIATQNVDLELNKSSLPTQIKVDVINCVHQANNNGLLPIHNDDNFMTLSRLIMEIMECEILPDGTRNFRSLFQFQITENRIEDGKFIIKGILDVEDARLAAASGADALVVSNHGGRQLDGAESSIRVLPKIVDAYKEFLN